MISKFSEAHQKLRNKQRTQADKPGVDPLEQKLAGKVRRAEDRSRGQLCPHERVRARPILPNVMLKVTRTCFEGRMFLAPVDDHGEFRNLIGYCLARAANECAVQIHTCVVMSNHVHMDISDPHGRLPKFKQQFFSTLARGINHLRGRSDSLWSHDGSCDTRRTDDEPTLNDLVYTLTNPVKDGLVKWAHQWPGFTTQGWRFGESRTFKRPKFFFDPNGEMPDALTLTLERPPILRHLDDQELFEELMLEVRAREIHFQDEARVANRRFVGVDRLLRRRWGILPTTKKERFKRKPTIAASDPRLVREQVSRDREWRRKYAEARNTLLTGGHPLFPTGTYFLRHFAGVSVTAADSS